LAEKRATRCSQKKIGPGELPLSENRRRNKTEHEGKYTVAAEISLKERESG